MALFSFLFACFLPFIIRYSILWGVTFAFVLLPPMVMNMLGLQYNIGILFFCTAAAIVVCCIIIKYYHVRPVAKLFYVLANPALIFIVIYTYMLYSVYTGTGNDGGLAGFWEFLFSQEVRDFLFS